MLLCKTDSAKVRAPGGPVSRRAAARWIFGTDDRRRRELDVSKEKILRRNSSPDAPHRAHVYSRQIGRVLLLRGLRCIGWLRRHRFWLGDDCAWSAAMIRNDKHDKLVISTVNHLLMIFFHRLLTIFSVRVKWRNVSNVFPLNKQAQSPRQEGSAHFRPVERAYGC